MTADRPACRVILVGMMGSGKTTIGRLLAEQTGWPYVDNDELVRRRHGRSSREILATEGEPMLRQAERSALALGVELSPPVIVGVAAGAILDAANRERLTGGGIVVWLRAGAAALTGRAMDEAHRPFVDTAGAAWLAQAVRDREPLYESVADLIVDTDTASPESTADTILAHLASVPDCER